MKYKKSLLLLIPLGLALTGIGYGLPMHFVGDEEALVGGAMKMLELNTIVPTLHPEVFNFYYYGPLLAYLIIIASAPVIIWQLVNLGAVSGVMDYFALNQELIWYASRVLTALVSVGVLAILYQIAKRLFNSRVALLSVLFLGTSFFHVLLSHWMRHWMFTVFFAYLTFLIGLIFIQKGNKKYAYLTGVVAGLGFANIYISVLGLAAVLVYWWSQRKQINEFWKNVWRAGLSFIVVGIGLALLNIQQLVRIFGPVDGTITHPKSLVGLVDFLGSYFLIFWRQELILVVLAVLAIILLYRRRSVWFNIISIVAYAFILYFLLHLELRYVYLVIPALCILAGLVLDYLRKLIKPRLAWVILIFLLMFWPTISLFRYEYLLLQPDTRELAVDWIQDEIPPAEYFILSSPTIELPRTREALLLDQSFGRIRAPERYLISNQDLAEPSKARSFVNLHFWSDDSSIEQLEELIDDLQPRYFIMDYWHEGEINQLESWLSSNGQLVQKFTQSDLPINYDINGNFNEFNSVLFQLNRLGPNVEIYRIDRIEL